MKTSTTAQNQNSQQGGRDLGQIIKKERHSDFAFDVFAIFGQLEVCEVTYKGMNLKATVTLNKKTERREALDLLIELGWGFQAASCIDRLMSPSKAWRESAKAELRDMANLGAWVISEAHTRILAARNGD